VHRDRRGRLGALNMWYDADIDAVMTRTSRRPIPAGASSPARRSASADARGRLVAGVRRAGELVRPRAARLHDRFYVFVYTMLAEALDAAEHRHRRRGRRLPPMIGWAAVTGDVSLAPV
jgi:protoheme IX farnesyltransferase